MALQSMVDRQRGRAPESWGAGPPGGYGATQYDAATLGHAVSQQHLLDQMAAYGLPPAQDTSYGAPLRRCVASVITSMPRVVSLPKCWSCLLIFWGCLLIFLKRTAVCLDVIRLSSCIP